MNRLLVAISVLLGRPVAYRLDFTGKTEVKQAAPVAIWQGNTFDQLFINGREKFVRTDGALLDASYFKEEADQ